MITQAIKNWLRELFAWWPWKQSPHISHFHAASSLNKGLSQETTSRPTIGGVAPQAGIIPRLSTIEEWPEHVVQPQPQFPNASEHTERPLLPPPPALSPTEQPEDKQTPERESTSVTKEPDHNVPSTPERQLEFLEYLVRHGIVNEGFEKGKEPEQYRKM